MDINEKIWNYASFLLLRNIYTEKQLMDKLKRKFKNEKEIIRTINRLKELELINDYTYAVSYLAYRTKRSPRGSFKLKEEMYLKGIPSDIQDMAFKAAKIDEEDLARKAVEKKMPMIKNYPDKKKKEKLTRFLISRGFSYDVIKKAIKH